MTTATPLAAMNLAQPRYMPSKQDIGGHAAAVDVIDAGQRLVGVGLGDAQIDGVAVGLGLELHGAHDQPGRGGVLLGVADFRDGPEHLLSLEGLRRVALGDQLLTAGHVAGIPLGHGGQQATEARVEACVVGDIEDHGVIRSHLFAGGPVPLISASGSSLAGVSWAPTPGAMPRGPDEGRAATWHRTFRADEERNPKPARSCVPSPSTHIDGDRGHFDRPLLPCKTGLPSSLGVVMGPIRVGVVVAVIASIGGLALPALAPAVAVRVRSPRRQHPRRRRARRASAL